MARHKGTPAVLPRLSDPEPRHRAEHVHSFLIVAEFDGLRASIGECFCGEVRTLWRTGPRVYDLDTDL